MESSIISILDWDRNIDAKSLDTLLIIWYVPIVSDGIAACVVILKSDKLVIIVFQDECKTPFGLNDLLVVCVTVIVLVPVVIPAEKLG